VARAVGQFSPRVRHVLPGGGCVGEVRVLTRGVLSPVAGEGRSEVGCPGRLEGVRSRAGAVWALLGLPIRSGPFVGGADGARRGCGWARVDGHSDLRS